ncbi:uncharacterized protein LOC111251238 isoform X2 [Varroa destructor]|uniref:Uncharacterized protein n=1 Tax=Varroa destructor TaxID=109461 RepID=A0A7M7KN19_VARDE|nr:uncharacterized protein LOC111251238 isoform X2 [Varroa destructor]
MTITVFVLGCILTLLSYCCGTTRATTTASSKEETGGLDFDRCGFTALDHATADLVFFGNGPLAPISEEELVDECVRLRASLRSTKRYANNCTMGLGQVMLKMFVEAARKELEYRCDGKGKEEYLKLTPCLVEKSGPALHKCNVRYSGYLQAITEQNKTDRIPFACCYHAKFERCVTNVAKKCGEEHAKFSAKV